MNANSGRNPDGPETFGIDHLTVVPENLQRRPGTGSDDEA